MSVNLNSNIIKAVQPFVNRNGLSYNFPANVWAQAGGGGGVPGTSFGGLFQGGGGGAGAFLSSSLSVIPNVTWTINVGGGGASGTNGQDTYATIYNDTYAGITNIKAQGGRTGNLSTGGNSGTGSIITPSGTFNYTGFTGGANVGNKGGGGAGTTQNGQPADVSAGGNGGEGNDDTGVVIGGGGGGGAFGINGAGGTGNDGGGNGAGEAILNGFNAIAIGAGGGGGAIRNDEGIITSGSGGNGSNGIFLIQFEGTIGTALNQYDIAVTNATITKAGNTTTITYNSGSGTFRYTAPYPYVPGN
jgi:hypothetical protein